MWDPQVKLKGVIIRVNLDSGMSQVVLVSARGLVWPMVLYARKKCM